ncbi:MAG: PEP-CTERM sorting domain-containing protein [Bryobacteraceae bacterium]
MLRRFRAYKMWVLFLALPAWALPVFQVQAIAPAGYTSSATAINASGAVVGNYLMPDGTFRAFLWQNGQSTSLELPTGAVQTWATAISGTGQAGGYMDSQQSPQGVVWDNFGNHAATAGNYIRGLNANGDAAGMAIGGDGAGYAFVTRNGVMTSLGQPAGGDWSTASAINSAGKAAGTAMNASGAFQAFTASADGNIALLNGLGGANAYAKAINGIGVVAGHAQTAAGALQATIWYGTNAVGLGTLGGVNSYAYAINAARQVAGYSDLDGSAGTAAFLYDHGILYDLNALLGPGSEWQLLAAYGMNDSGQIVGKGLLNGQERAFLLTPVSESPSALISAVPEPSSLWLAGPTLLAYFAFRNRKRISVSNRR